MHVDWKGPGDRVTDIDVAIQAQLVERIRARFPDDPLDGTNNFALGTPASCTIPIPGSPARPCAGTVPWLAAGRPSCPHGP
jgi:hypothetical protein